MTGTISYADQQRRNNGSHINWLDNRQGDQQTQNRIVTNLARQPGDWQKQNNAQAWLQLLALLSVIQPGSTTPLHRQTRELPDDQAVALNSTQLSAPSDFSPLANMTQQTVIMPQRNSRSILNTAKHKSSARGAGAGKASGKTKARQKVFVLVKKDFHEDIDKDVYQLALTKGTPKEILILRKTIFKIRLREGNDNSPATAALIKLFDDYQLYKDALSRLDQDLINKGIQPLLLQKASELYALTGDDGTVKYQRQLLKVQLYRLEELSKGKLKIDFRPFSLTANPENDKTSTYDNVESKMAGQLLEDVVSNTPEVPAQHIITYGPAYQARKSFLAYAFHSAGIHSEKSLAQEPEKNKAALYKKLLGNLQNNITSNKELLDEIADHFYFSLYFSYMANPDTNLAISASEVKRLGDFTQRDKVNALLYHFNQDIEIKFKPQQSNKDTFLYLAQEFIFSSSLTKDNGPSKSRRAGHKVHKTAKRPSKGHKIRHHKKGNIRNPPAQQKGVTAKMKKPLRKDFDDQDSYQAAKSKYESHLKARVALTENFDRPRRQLMAVSKMKQLQETHPNEIITQKSQAGFTLTTAEGDRGKALILSSHAWSDKYTGELKLPKNKKIFFLGPEGKVLLEAPEAGDLLPTSNLVAGEKDPEIYSAFTDEGIQILSNREATSVTYEDVKNYRLKHYEATPDEEVQLAVLQNRIRRSGMKMDFLTVDELAGEKKLSDVFHLMHRDKLLQDYDKVIFYACREVKATGVLTKGVGASSYEIKFTDTPLAEQTKFKRSVGEPFNEEVDFDGYYLHERFEVTKENMTSTFAGITPYQVLE